jgi:Fe-S cluster biogenesis protein NfuA
MAQLRRQLDEQHGQRIERLEQLLREAESATDPAWREKLREVVQTLLEFHGEAVARIVARLEDAGAPGRTILSDLAEDDLVHSMLVLYDVHPEAFATRVEAALGRVRPSLASHGGDVELLECTAEGVVRLRLHGSCHGCPSSQLTLKQTIEESLYAAAPDITVLEVEGVAAETAPPSSGFVPLSMLAPLGNSKRPEGRSVSVPLA